MREYKDLVPGLAAIWAQFVDRDWALARADYVQHVVDATIAVTSGFQMVQGASLALDAAELAYAEEYAAGTVLKALAATKNAARVGRAQVQAAFAQASAEAGAAQAARAAMRAQGLAALQTIKAQRAATVARASTATARQNMSWIRSWLYRINPGAGTHNCQLTSNAVSAALREGMVGNTAVIRATGFQGAIGQGVVQDLGGYGKSLGGTFVRTDFAGVERVLAGRASGSQVVVYVQNGLTSHVFNGVNLNGSLFFIDGQTGAVSRFVVDVAGAAGYANPAAVRVLALP